MPREWTVRASRDGGAVRVYYYGRLREEILPGDDTYEAGRATATKFAHKLALEFRRPNMQGKVTRGTCEVRTLDRALRRLLAVAEEGGMPIGRSDAIVTEVMAAVLLLDELEVDAEAECGTALDDLRDFLYDDEEDDDDDDEDDDDDDDDDDDECELNPTGGGEDKEEFSLAQIKHAARKQTR